MPPRGELYLECAQSVFPTRTRRTSGPCHRLKNQLLVKFPQPEIHFNHPRWSSFCDVRTNNHQPASLTAAFYVCSNASNYAANSRNRTMIDNSKQSCALSICSGTAACPDQRNWHQTRFLRGSLSPAQNRQPLTEAALLAAQAAKL